MLDKLKLYLNIDTDDKDDLLTLIIDQAIEFATNYTHSNNLTSLYPLILKMCVFDYNRIGTEGLNSESYSGVSFNYANDYPEYILRSLRSKRRIITL